MAAVVRTRGQPNSKPAWRSRFEDSARRIYSGSGLLAKPIVDIVLVVRESAKEDEYAPLLREAGYELTVREPDWYEHRMFKGPDREVNLHVFSADCPEVARMVNFRDWLRTNDNDRNLYARHKLVLAQEEWKDIQDYADAKTAVIEEILSRANACNCP